MDRTPNRRRGHFLRIAALAAVALLAVAGCKKLDLRKLEDAIKTQSETQVGVQVKSVKCPDARELKKGDTFECTITADDGSTATVVVEQLDAEGNVHWAMNNTLDLRNMEKLVQAELEVQTGVTFRSVDCPMLREAKPGDTFECTATAQDGSTTALAVEQTDAEGNAHWKLAGTTDPATPPAQPAAE